MFVNVITCLSVASFFTVMKYSDLFTVNLMFIGFVILSKLFKGIFNNGIKVAVSVSLLSGTLLNYLIYYKVPVAALYSMQRLVGIFVNLVYAFVILTYLTWKCERHVKKIETHDVVLTEYSVFEAAIGIQSLIIMFALIISCVFFYLNSRAYLTQVLITVVIVFVMCVTAKAAALMVFKDRLKKLAGTINE